METKKTSGIGRLLIAIYGVFAVSASARAIYQLGTEFEEAPFAYTLSAISALVYILATIALAKQGSFWSRLALATITFEL